MKIKKITLQQIKECLNAEIIDIVGTTKDVFVDNLADSDNVNETTLDWVNPSKDNKQKVAEETMARVILVDPSVSYSQIMKKKGKTLIYTLNPKHALAKLGNCYFVEKTDAFIHPTAIIAEKALLGKNVSVGPYAVIGEVEIGDDCVIGPFVRLYDDVIIGKHCVVKEGAVIGGEGFGFERDEDGNRFRFPQIGGVRIGDFVEVGANTCIDRGALSDTIIEDYAKIDNLCHIAHNVHIGENAVVVACAEVSGSCVIGSNTWIGPNACIRDQRNVGSGTLIGMGSVVVKHIGDHEVWAGNPAKKL